MDLQQQKQQQFNQNYQAGLTAFEQGKYRLSVQYLEQATEALAPGTRLSGEARMWLVSAYQASGRQQEGLSLCRQLTKHPHPQIRKQAQRLLYILEAPRLNRPKEWMTEIPDLGKAPETVKYLGSGSSQKRSIPSSPAIKPVDLTQVNDKDNKFIWVALFGALLIVGGLIFQAL
ncbi:conserved hypothetical protein [Gloeothece citriformis PCC 7424]|uniref:Uncharacterized protein n=1 Tax=Gloeothece citriformis (strain PCC 7424) TaxID=65393 RepID=B7KKI5_GLOC7|nr:hypothetical protein [Gloeothece citriformis]ACK72318.1 conserved hypothetical protein [Gloeothece citriformis PCC 7424]